MTISIKSNSNVERQIAEQDIVVSKLFQRNLDENGCYLSACRGFPYKLGERYDGELENPNRMFGEKLVETGTINIGFHSYQVDSGRRDKIMIINFDKDFRLIKCIIPKGSEYYYNPEFEEYVSNSIIIGTENDILK